MIKNASKYQIATAITILFHCIGLAGFFFFDRQFFTRSTPLNLLLSFSLLIWTQRIKAKAFLLFMCMVVVLGYLSEVAGTNTGLLFGNYSYGKVLGPQYFQVPLLIGINWFIIIYCCGISTQAVLLKVNKRAALDNNGQQLLLKAMLVIVDGATLAVMFDMLMEPVAVKLGFWIWSGDGSIPLYNYVCWFVISLMLLTIFHLCKFNKENKFAVNLLLIQALFFLILRTFLK